MSILIPGMKMPKDGVKHLCIYPDGTIFDTMEFQGPLAKAIELPPHGDLIDRSKIVYWQDDSGLRSMDFVRRAQLDVVTPVIPAEEE